MRVPNIVVCTAALNGQKIFNSYSSLYYLVTSCYLLAYFCNSIKKVNAAANGLND